MPRKLTLEKRKELLIDAIRRRTDEATIAELENVLIRRLADALREE